MKALTLWQPWAEWVACGAKRCETRSWGTRHRGALGIHAAKARRMLTLGTIEGESCLTDLKELRNILEDLDPDTLAYGALVAITTLVDVRQITPELAREQSPVERALGDWRPGRFAWFLEDVERLEIPAPLRGRQGLWETKLHQGARPYGRER